LLDEQGNYSPNGTAKLTAPSDMQPNSGYSKGKWDEAPPDEVSGTEPVTYTYRYSKALAPWIPKTGDDSNIGALLAAMGMSLTGILGSAFMLKRRKKERN